MERIAILLSILIICYLSWNLFKGKALAFIFTAALVLFASTVVLSGFVGGSIGVAVNGYVVLGGSIIFAFFGKILIVQDNKKNLARGGIRSGEMPDNSEGNESSLVFLLAFLSWTILTIYLASWQITPHGGSVDAAAHYSLAKYLFESQHLPTGDWAFLWEIANYPFGFHLTTALIAKLFAVDPFYVMWIFAALLMSVVVASVCTMIYSDLKNRGYVAKLAALWAFAMFVASPYVAESYSASGFYPMILGLVYIVLFVWCLRIFTEITRAKILFAAIVLSGMGMTYPQWLPLIFLMYAYLVYSKVNVSGTNKIVVLGLPVAIAAAFSAIFALQNWEGLKYIYNIEGWVIRDLRYLGLLTGASILMILAISYKKICQDYLYTLLVTVVLVSLVATSKVIAGFGGMYPIYKYAYVLSPLFILLISQSFSSNKEKGIRGNFKIAIPFVVLLATFSNFKILSHQFNPSLKENEFQALEWVKNNTSVPEVTYFGEPPFALFGYAITGKPQNRGEFGWWVQPSFKFETWMAQAVSGEIAVRSHVQLNDSENTRNENFQVLYKDGDCIVLKKI